MVKRTTKTKKISDKSPEYNDFMTFFSISDSGWRHSLTISRSDCRERILTSSELRPSESTPHDPRPSRVERRGLVVVVVIGPVPGQTDHPRRDSTRPARQVSKRSLIPLPSACGEGVGKLARKSRTPTDLEREKVVDTHRPMEREKVVDTHQPAGGKSRGHQTRSGFSSVSSGRNSESSTSMLIGRRG